MNISSNDINYLNSFQKAQDELRNLAEDTLPDDMKSRWDQAQSQLDQSFLHVLGRITMLQSDNLQLRQHSNMDIMTGLANRRFFNDELEKAFNRAKRQRLPITLISFDMDKLKTINDVYGHHAGDLMLKVLAGLCQKVVRKGETIARTGGEEFTVIMEGTSLKAGEQAAKRLMDQIGMTLRDNTYQACLEGHPQEDISLVAKILRERGLTCSFGVAAYEQDNKQSWIHNTTDLKEMADTALYMCKGQPVKNRWASVVPALPQNQTRNQVAVFALSSEGQPSVDVTQHGANAQDRGVHTMHLVA